MVHVHRVMLVPLEGTYGAEHLGHVLHGDVVLRQPLNKDPVLTHSSHWFFPKSLFRNSFGEKFAALVLHVTQSHVVLCLKHILLVALGAVVLVLKQLLCLSELWHRLEDLVLYTHVTPQLPLGGKPGNALLVLASQPLPICRVRFERDQVWEFFSAESAASTNFCRNQPFLLYLVKLKFVKKV